MQTLTDTEVANIINSLREGQKLSITLNANKDSEWTITDEQADALRAIYYMLERGSLRISDSQDLKLANAMMSDAWSQGSDRTLTVLITDSFDAEWLIRSLHSVVTALEVQ